MKRFIRTPSPSMVVACAALFVSLGGVSYAVATIDSADIVNGSIRNRDFKDGTLRGHESKPDGFGPNAIWRRRPLRRCSPASRSAWWSSTAWTVVSSCIGRS